MPKLKMIVFDVDGTLTDGKLYIGPTGEVFKAFNAHDAVGIRKLKEYGIISIIITGRESELVNIRAKEMNITKVYQNVQTKEEELKKAMKEFKVKKENVGYIGDDINDLEAMKKCSFKACPQDAVKEIKEICDYISPCKCNEAAVREIIDNVILKDM